MPSTASHMSSRESVYCFYPILEEAGRVYCFLSVVSVSHISCIEKIRETLLNLSFTFWRAYLVPSAVAFSHISFAIGLYHMEFVTFWRTYCVSSAVAVSRISLARNAKLTVTNSICTSRALSMSHIPLRRCLSHFLRS